MEEVRHASVGAALIRLELGPLGGSELLSNPNRALVGCFVLYGTLLKPWCADSVVGLLPSGAD